ncbi:MAG: glutathione synthase [Bacteroidetes bacterium]|nr:glutathione synthase [Bacteroidota bacterium]
MNILFIMDPWHEVDPETDSTLRLVHEAAIRGHIVAIVYPNNLTIRDSITSGFCRVIRKSSPVSKNISLFHKRVEFREEMFPLAGFDVIFIRTNPPIDNIMLNFLDSVKNDTFIVNNIEGLREANNKLYTAVFHDPDNEIIPGTYVSKNKEYLKRIISESPNQRMILKPLNGFGGSGVIVIEKNAMQNINSLLDFYIGGNERPSNYVILQEYVEGAENGDVRILMLNGEPIGAMRRIPSNDDVRSNVHAGGSVAKHTLTRKEKLLCKKIGPKLVADGLYFVGLDVISGKLIEVNVCSPGGITRINRLNKVKIQQLVLDFVEGVAREKFMVASRKSELRKTVFND